MILRASISRLGRFQSTRAGQNAMRPTVPRAFLMDVQLIETRRGKKGRLGRWIRFCLSFWLHGGTPRSVKEPHTRCSEIGSTGTPRLRAVSVSLGRGPQGDC
jgi:hypothetical protein